MIAGFLVELDLRDVTLVWGDDSRTLIPIDQPEVLTAHLEEFLARTTTP